MLNKVICFFFKFYLDFPSQKEIIILEMNINLYNEFAGRVLLFLQAMHAVSWSPDGVELNSIDHT